MVSCQFNPMLGRYHDGELPPAQRPAFEAHLASCDACATELRVLRSMSQALRAEPMPRADGAFLARLESLASNVEDLSILRFARRLTGIAAAILVVATLNWALHSSAAPAREALIPRSVVEEHHAVDHLIVDPDSAASSVGNENAVASVDMGPIAADFSGGRQ